MFGGGSLVHKYIETDTAILFQNYLEENRMNSLCFRDFWSLARLSGQGGLEVLDRVFKHGVIAEAYCDHHGAL